MNKWINSICKNNPDTCYVSEEENQIKRLNNEYDKTNMDIIFLKKKIEEKQNELSNLKIQINATNNNLLSLEVNFEKRNDELSNLKIQNDTINNDLSSLKSNFKKIDSDLYNLTNTNIAGSYKISQYVDNEYGNTNTRIGWYGYNFVDNGLGNVCIGGISNGGFYGFCNGNNNISLGNVTLTKNNTGNFNVALGHNSQYSCISGIANTTIGHTALYDNEIGNYNVALGSAAGNNNKGSNNTFIGRRAGRKSDGTIVNYNYTTCIGTESIATGNRQIILGTSLDNVYSRNSINITTKTLVF